MKLAAGEPAAARHADEERAAGADRGHAGPSESTDDFHYRRNELQAMVRESHGEKVEAAIGERA